MPAKDRGTRSAAPSASPAPGGSRSSRSRSSKTADSVSTEDSVDAVNEDDENDEDEDEGQEALASAGAEEETEAEVSEDAGKLSMKERMEKMKELRGRMVCHTGSPLCIAHLTFRTKVQQPIDAISLRIIRNQWLQLKNSLV